MEDLTRIFSLEEVDVLFKSVDQFGHEGRLHILFQYRFYSRRCVMLRWHPNQTWSGVKRSRWEIKLQIYQPLQPPTKTQKSGLICTNPRFFMSDTETDVLCRFWSPRLPSQTIEDCGSILEITNKENILVLEIFQDFLIHISYSARYVYIFKNLLKFKKGLLHVCHDDIPRTAL